MKIGILTQPLRTNYGGLLQAYALQTVLQRLGHDVTILNRCYPKTHESLLSKILNIKNIVLGKNAICYDKKKNVFVEENTSRFIDNNYKLSAPFYTSESLREYVISNNFNAIIVGSDQVWRPRYSPNIFNYFLDFTEGTDIKRYSYAASYGVDIWEFNQQESDICSRLAQSFNGITVREASAVELCEIYLKVKAEHVLDPSLLLSSSDYTALLTGKKTINKKGIFTYILDAGDEKKHIIENAKKTTGKDSFTCMPKLKFNYKNAKEDLSGCQFPAVEQWIQSFVDAEMVITDSFHGTAFSIIFNKPFWVIGNERRGNTRMESLLEMFGLKDRMVNESSINTIDWNTPIDWEKVNDIKKKWQMKSMYFFTNL